MVRTGEEERELAVTVRTPQATVGDLLEALALDASGLSVAGEFVGSEVPLRQAGLLDGSVVEPAETHSTRPPDEAQHARLAVTTGPAAGCWLSLTSGRTYRVGRGVQTDLPLADPSVSDVHAIVAVSATGELTIEDAGSTNGTWVDGESIHRAELGIGRAVRVGASTLQVEDARPDDRPTGTRAGPGSRRVPFNRPPRGGLPGPPDPVAVPEAPGDEPVERGFSVLMLLGPLVFAGALVALYGNLRFALFALLSPVMMLGNWLASRQQARRQRRRNEQQWQAAIQALREDLAGAARRERTRRAAVLPHPAEVLRRATAPSTRLWERRPDHPDFLHLRAGTGTVPWDPPTSTGAQAEPAAAVRAVLDRHRGLDRAPAGVRLADGGAVGIVGDRAASLAVARSLVCQAAVHHGPADLALGVFPGREHAPSWDWTKWLPHLQAGDHDGPLTAADRADAARLLASLLDAQAGGGPPGTPTRLLVFDDLELLGGRGAPGRRLLAGDGPATAGIVLAPSADRLPASATAVIELHSDLGDGVLRRPASGRTVHGLLSAGLSEDGARRCARALARFEDPERPHAGGRLPETVRLLSLLGLDAPGARATGQATGEATEEAVRRAWRATGPDPGLSTPIGIGERGPVRLDLVTDGPHALIGGTTGSGKSELLRSAVAGIAARVSPEHCTFVLVDYKGGSAFDRCAELPHCVGLVTDLDEHLGRRALVSLEAELAHREQVLRTAGAEDLPAYLAAGAPAGPLPRLVVIIDEFAALAKELPDFLDALIDVAQRGRSLGVHLWLATQRPSGAVDANIQANTNLRIALRVQDRDDSSDIIDRPDAARLRRTRPGRAFVRRGHGDVVRMQTALVSASFATDGPAVPLELAPFTVAARDAETGGPETGGPDGQATDTGDPTHPGGRPDRDGPTDLERVVAAVRAAHASRGAGPPRRPWLPELPDRLAFDQLRGALGADAGGPGDREGEFAFALADEPAAQRQVAVGWRPARGHLALLGTVGSGTTTALLAVARSLAEHNHVADCHLYGLDFGSGELEQLTALPHVGSVITATDGEGQHRLVRMLRGELDRRRGLERGELTARPLLVTLIDNVAGFLAEHEDLAGAELTDAFRRLFSEGPAVGIVFAVTGDRPGALPLRLSGLVGQKLLLRLADPSAFAALGMRAGELPAFVPGRGVLAEDRRVVQIALPGDLAAVGQRLGPEAADADRPRPVGTLPEEVHVSQLPHADSLQTRPVRLPVGIADDDLGPAHLHLHEGEHALVAGPPRSGKTTALTSLALTVRRADPEAVLVGVAPTRSPLCQLPVLDAGGQPEDLEAVLRRAVTDDRWWMLLVDDAPRVGDPHGLLAAAIDSRRPDLHVVVAGQARALLGGLSHWSRPVRASCTGLLLQPDLAADGELLGTRLPRRLAVSPAPGRGFLVNDGRAALIQTARPDELS